MKISDYVLMLEGNCISEWSLMCMTTFDSIQYAKKFSLGNIHGHTPHVYVHWKNANHKAIECSVLGWFSPRNDTGEASFRAPYNDILQLRQFVGILNENLYVYQLAMI